MITETVTATTATATSAGVFALLLGLFGQVGADVIMVIMSAITGNLIAISAISGQSTKESVMYMIISIMASLVLAWVFTGAIVSAIPAMNNPYLPSLIAMFIGVGSSRLSGIMNKVINKAEERI